MYTYFVSFYVLKDGSDVALPANGIVERQNQINSTEEIRSLEEFIISETGVDFVTLNSFQLLKEERKARIETYIGIRLEE